MNIRATVIATILLVLAGGCSSSGERATAADQTWHDETAIQPPASPPPPPLPSDDKRIPPQPSPTVKDLPPDKAVASTEVDRVPQAKLADNRNMADVLPQSYRPRDLPLSGQAGQVAPFPREVTNFMVERDSCDHFRGEEPYDADRRAYLAENIAELCTGTDGRLAALRMRYANDPAVIAALSSYEDRVEDNAGKGKYIGK